MALQVLQATEAMKQNGFANALNSTSVMQAASVFTSGATVTDAPTNTRLPTVSYPSLSALDG